MKRFTKKIAIDLAKDAINNGVTAKKNVIKGKSNAMKDLNIVCEVLIANNLGEVVTSNNFFKNCNVRFNYIIRNETLFECHNENIHFDEPHAHLGKNRTKISLDKKLVSGVLASSTEFIEDGFDKWYEKNQ